MYIYKYVCWWIADAQRRLCKPPTSSVIAVHKDVCVSRRLAVRLRGYKDVCISRLRADRGSAEMYYSTPADIHLSL